MKATAEAPSNIAFVKYWGAVDLDRVLPANPSISMTLSRCVSRTTAELLNEEGEDEIFQVDDDGRMHPAAPGFARRALAHLETIRRSTGAEGRFRVATRNSFPSDAGIASSASGFTALALAGSRAAGRELAPEELSELARLSGSGSASRSAFGGYVEWPAPGTTAEEAGPDSTPPVPAAPIAPAEHWDLRDVIALVETGPKEVSSVDGHRRAATSPHFPTRQSLLAERLERTRDAIRSRDLNALGPVLEEEAIELHLIAFSSRPPIFYWTGATLEVLAALRALRRDGLSAWATMDAGANVHVLCEAADAPAVATALRGVPGVSSVIEDGVGSGPRLVDGHFF